MLQRPLRECPGDLLASNPGSFSGREPGFEHRLKRGGEGLETADIGAFLFFVVLSYP